MWSRDGLERSAVVGLDADGVREAWSARDAASRFGLVSLPSEAAPEFPDKKAFVNDPLLLTQRALEEQGAFPTKPLGGRFSGLHSIRLGARPPTPAALPTFPPSPQGSDDVPVLPPETVAILGDVLMGGLTGHRLVRRALIDLDVRLGRDLAVVTEGMMLERLGGDRARLENFRDQANAHALRLVHPRERPRKPGVATATTGTTDPYAAAVPRNATRSPAPDAEMASRDATFREAPLRESVRRSLEALDARDAEILSRKLGLDGPSASVAAIMEAAGIGRSRVFQVFEEAIAELDRTDGWPGRLKRMAREFLPVSASDLVRSPWFTGLGIEQVAALTWFGAGEPIHVIETAAGAVVGHLKAGEWKSACRKARDLIRSTGGDANQSKFLEDLRDCLPSGYGSYERFLLAEIGWPSDPGPDWLLGLKGKMATVELVRHAVDRLPSPVRHRSLMAVVEAYTPEVSSRYLLDVISREARRADEGRKNPSGRRNADCEITMQDDASTQEEPTSRQIGL